MAQLLTSSAKLKSRPKETEDHEVSSPQVAAWRAFVRYVIKQCGDGCMIASISVLVNKNSPLAWRVTAHPIPEFYSAQDGGESGDIARQWAALSRHLLSKCSSNGALAVLEIGSIVVHKGRPLMWTEASLLRIYPAEMGAPEAEGEEVACRILYPNYIRSDGPGTQAT